MKMYKIFLLTLSLFCFNFAANADQSTDNQTQTEQSSALVLEQTPNADIVEVIKDAREVVDALPKQVDSTDQLASWETFIYAIIMTLIGFLSKYIPVLNNITDTWQRVAAAAIALVLGLTVYKGELPIFEIIQYVVSFVLSTRLIYPAIIKPIAKTPKVA